MTPQPIETLGNRGTRRYRIGSQRRYDRYIRSLVNRIEDILDPSFLMDWNILLKEKNHGKRGRPFKIPNAFITFLAGIRAVFNVPFKSLEGIARLFSRITGIGCGTQLFFTLFLNSSRILSYYNINSLPNVSSWNICLS